MPLTAPETSATGLPGHAEPTGLGKLRRWAPALCLSALTVLYLVPTCIRAAHVKLWYDEIHTFDAAALLPAPRVFWSFLTRAEASPPLGFILAAGSESVFGKNEFAVRLPFVIAFWVMALCLYFFLVRRVPWPFALAATLLTGLTAANLLP